MKKKLTLIIPGLLMEGLFLLYKFYKTTPAQAVIKYMIVWAAAFILVSVTYRFAKEHEFSRFFFITVIFFTFVFGITLIAAPPDQSDDIYRYIWDGKVQYNHINPYTYAPNDPALAKFHSKDLPALVNFPLMKSIYPPVAQVFFLVSYTIFGESIAGMKFLFLLAALGGAFFFYSILERFGSQPRWLLFFAWNPLIIMETAINGHLDIVMVFFLLMGLWLFYKKSYILSGIGMALAVMTKLIPIILLPLFFFYLIDDSKRVTQPTHPVYRFFIPLVSTVVACYALYFSSAPNMFLVVLKYSTTWYFNNPLFFFILFLFKTNAAAHVVSFSLFIIVYLVILTRPIELREKIVHAVTAFVVLNPTIHPWYLTILTGLLCMSGSAAIVLWSGTVISAYAVVYRYKSIGKWNDSWIIMMIEYIPIILLLGYRVYRERREESMRLRQGNWTDRS